MFNKTLILKAVAVSALFVSTGWATMVSTAPGYGEAKHVNADWQRLGLDNTLNDGVMWSTDNGVTYGNDVIEAGDQVIFRFQMYKDRWGTHHYDAIRVWIDMGQDNSFDPSDLVLQDKWEFNQGQGYNDNWTPNNGQTDLFWAKQSSMFYSNAITFAGEGDFWLRSRVLCSADLSGIWYGNVNNPNTLPSDAVLFQNFSSVGQVGNGQGEVEDWKLSVVRRVPEPATMSLLGLGFIALALYRRRK